MLDKKINETIDLLIKKIKENNLTSIKLSNKSNTIEISNNLTSQFSNQNTQNIPTTSNQNINDENNKSLISIDSPMVGIIYLTPKPSSPPFAKKGQKIKKGDTICLIEAMKTFNEIKSDRDCTIKSVLVKNGEAVEFGQPLFEIS
jgi:acetyl-CoA carboxylase biotin carboxyl carrier protein